MVVIAPIVAQSAAFSLEHRELEIERSRCTHARENLDDMRCATEVSLEQAEQSLRPNLE